jgi:hypothetical protein
MSTPATSSVSSSWISVPSTRLSTTRWMCLVIAPFFAPVAFVRSFSSGAIPVRICSAATATCSSSRGASRRSSRMAALRTSSRIFFES